MSHADLPPQQYLPKLTKNELKGILTDYGFDNLIPIKEEKKQYYLDMVKQHVYNSAPSCTTPHATPQARPMPRSCPRRTPRGEVNQDLGHGLSPTTGFPSAVPLTPKENNNGSPFAVSTTPTENKTPQPQPSQPTAYVAPTCDDVSNTVTTEAAQPKSGFCSSLKKFFFFLIILSTLIAVGYYSFIYWSEVCSAALYTYNQTSKFITQLVTIFHSVKEFLTNTWDVMSSIKSYEELDNVFRTHVTKSKEFIIANIRIIVMVLVGLMVFLKFVSNCKSRNRFVRQVYLDVLKYVEQNQKKDVFVDHLPGTMEQEHGYKAKKVKKVMKKVEKMIEENDIIIVSEALNDGIKRKCWRYSVPHNY
ncbi:hypothetical protein P9112_010530 [Eukaryota sp. TZLM1-RC]